MRKNRFDFTFRCLLALVFTVILAGHASAQLYWSGTGLNPATAGAGTWDNANSQWSSTFPTYTAAVWDSNIANFNGTGGGIVTVGAAIQVNDLNFGANAGAFTLQTGAGNSLVFLGTGITNNSANTQTIDNVGTNSAAQFVNSASAGNVSINNSGTGSSASFLNNATAANAHIINSGMTSSTFFFGGATAANSTITNSGMASYTQFNVNSTAANANIMNSAFESATFFHDSATAGNATITNSALASYMSFSDTSTGGNATLINGAANAFIDISGLTNAGMTAGSIAGAGAVRLGSKDLAVGGNNTSTTFSGVIQDGGTSGGIGGSLTKIGTGTLTLSGTNTYTGETFVIIGSLLVDGSIASPVTFAIDGGLLGGNGIIGGDLNVNDGGVVSPGDSPGTLTVTGHYTQGFAGILRIEIGGLTVGQHDLLAIGGSASLNGTLQLLRFNNFAPANGDQVIIMTHSSINNTGQFSLVTDDFPGLIRPQVFYDTSDVRVVFALVNSFSSQALTPNQKSVAHNLDDAANDPAAAALVGFLGSEPMGNLPHDYDLIAPEELAAIYEISISSSMVQNNNLQRRMDDIRAGSNGFCANGFTPQVSGKDYTKESDGKASLPDKSTRDVYTPSPDNRWGVFVTGTGDFVNVNNNDVNAHGYDITTGDFTVGADYRLCDHFAIGIDAGYSRSTADLVDDGRVDVDGGKIGAYATLFGKGLFGSKYYVDAGVGGGVNDYDTRRTGLQDELVRGDTDGTEFNAFIAYGSDWTFGCFNIGTWSTVQFTNVSIDQFTETGSLAPLVIEDQDENSFRSTTGVHASYDIKTAHAIFRPEVRVAYQHEYCDSAYQIDSQLASGAGGVFRVRGPNIGRDAALVGTGMNMQWNNRLSTYVYYDGVLGRNNYDNNAVSGGFRIGF